MAPLAVVAPLAAPPLTWAWTSGRYLWEEASASAEKRKRWRDGAVVLNVLVEVANVAADLVPRLQREGNDWYEAKGEPLPMCLRELSASCATAVVVGVGWRNEGNWARVGGMGVRTSA